MATICDPEWSRQRERARIKAEIRRKLLYAECEAEVKAELQEERRASQRRKVPSLSACLSAEDILTTLYDWGDI